MWKRLVVIRKDTEEEEEEEKELEGQRWLLWEWREHIRPSRLCGLSSY